MRVITVAEIARGSLGSVDQSGVLFAHEDRLYRAFSGESAALIRELLERPYLEELFSSGLVRFWTADATAEGFEFLVEVERLTPVAFPTEWPTRMFQVAAQRVVELCGALAERNVGVKDPHPWNVLFRGTEPVYVDLGSLVRQPEATSAWRSEFRRHFLGPLTLRRFGLMKLADAMSREHPSGPIKHFMDRPPFRSIFATAANRILARSVTPSQYYRLLGDYLASDKHLGKTMAWSDYDQKVVKIGDVASYSEKQSGVDYLLSTLEPSTLLDIACNRGWYSELAESRGFDVVAVDIDDRALGFLYESAAMKHLNILPLRIDVLWPVGSYGMRLCYSGPYERIRSDTVLALAILHHLVRNSQVTFHAFASLLDSLAHTAAIVEFVPRDDEYLADWELSSWYTEEAFVDAMRAFFPEVTRIPSSPDPRVLFMFQRDSAARARQI